jgi:hypothetical protein
MSNYNVGDLVRTNDNTVGIIIKHKPNEPVGASWVPERYVVLWFDTGKRKTEFAGDMNEMIELLSAAENEHVQKR